MTRLFGCTCNQPERLADALEPARTALVAEPPVSRWGFGYVQSGEVLLSRMPKRSTEPVDFFESLQRIRSDYVVAHATGDDGLSRNINTQPFRYRGWLFAQETELADLAQVQDDLVANVPSFLRRNVHGKTLSEYIFHIFLAKLHDANGIDDVNLPLAESQRAMHQATTVVSDILDRHKATYRLGNAIATNGRSMIAARLDTPLFMRNLTVPLPETERSKAERSKADRNNVFRGVLAVSSTTQPGEGFEEIPRGSALMITRDLRIDVGALAGSGQ